MNQQFTKVNLCKIIQQMSANHLLPRPEMCIGAEMVLKCELVLNKEKNSFLTEEFTFFLYEEEHILKRERKNAVFKMLITPKRFEGKLRVLVVREISEILSTEAQKQV